MVGAAHPWCDGYRDYYGNSIYNPRSVSNALSDGLCQSYWTATGSMDETSWYISNNVEAVCDDIVEMVAGNAVRIRFQEYYGADAASYPFRHTECNGGIDFSRTRL